MDKKNGVPRLLSLDVFRGITIVAMIVVNCSGSRGSYAWLKHSTWDGCTFADLVFPFFIVIVGMSSVLALANSKIKGISNRQLLIKIIKRSIYIFIIGLLLNAFLNPVDLSNLRILGVLQRIAICYFFAAILFLTTSMRVQVIAIIILLIGYWLLMAYFSDIHPLTMETNLVGYLDQLVLPHHLYTPMFDPEGLLSTLPAIATALLGNLMGICLISSQSKQQQLQYMITAGVVLSTLGWIWSFIFPINKSLWSSSYVLWTSGLSFLVFAVCFTLIEIKRWTLWSKPFLLCGRYALLIYILHVLFLKIQAVILVYNGKEELVNLRLYITEALFSNFTSQNASLSYAIMYTAFWLLVVKCIEKLRIGFRSRKRRLEKRS